MYYLILHCIISYLSSSISTFIVFFLSFLFASQCVVSCLCLTIKENFCDKCLMSYATWRKRRNRMQQKVRRRGEERDRARERENSSGNAIICNQTNPNALRVYQCHNLCVGSSFPPVPTTFLAPLPCLTNKNLEFTARNLIQWLQWSPAGVRYAPASKILCFTEC